VCYGEAEPDKRTSTTCRETGGIDPERELVPPKRRVGRQGGPKKNHTTWRRFRPNKRRAWGREGKGKSPMAWTKLRRPGWKKIRRGGKTVRCVKKREKKT